VLAIAPVLTACGGGGGGSGGGINEIVTALVAPPYRLAAASYVVAERDLHGAVHRLILSRAERTGERFK